DRDKRKCLRGIRKKSPRDRRTQSPDGPAHPLAHHRPCSGGALHQGRRPSDSQSTSQAPNGARRPNRPPRERELGLGSTTTIDEQHIEVDIPPKAEDEEPQSLQSPYDTPDIGHSSHPGPFVKLNRNLPDAPQKFVSTRIKHGQFGALYIQF